MIVSDFLRRSASNDPDKVALSFEERDMTYGDLDSATDRIACAMRELGVKRGDRIAIRTGNVPETVLSIFASSKAGGVFVPINPHLKDEKVRSILNKAAPALVVTEARSVPGWKGTTVSTHKDPGDSIPFQDLADAGSKVEVGSAIDVDIAAIMFTSGSTGDPKGVTLTHGNIDAASSSIISYLKNTPDDIIIDPIPLSFDYGLYQVIMGIKFGGRVVLERSFAFFNALLKRVEDESVTGFPLVPSMAEILLRMGDLKSYDLSSVRYVTNTAQALNPRTIAELGRVFQGAQIFSMYGLTECKRVSYLDPARLAQKPTSVGRAIPNTEIFLLDESFNRITEPGTIGELAVRGPHIMVGYWNDPESTEKVIVPGHYPGDKVLLTGDLFKFDHDGDFYYVGRKDEMLKIGGEKASPVEVERVLMSIEGVTGSVVVGVPDDLLGNVLVAVIATSGDLTEDAVKAFCSAKLERHLVPRRFAFVRDLPLTQNGKIDRRAVSENINDYMKG